MEIPPSTQTFTKKHPNKIGTEVESGEIDKFVTKELSVNIYYFFYINIFLHFMFFT